MRVRRGSAVIEVLLALSLAAFLIASLGNLISSVRRLEQSSNMRQRALTHVRFALELVTNEQRRLFACNSSNCTCSATTCTRGDGQSCTLMPAYQSCWTLMPAGLVGEGPYHLAEVSGLWQLIAGAETVPTDPDFTRSIAVQNLMRDAGGALVESGGTTDPSTKRITVTVSWNERGVAKSLNLSTMLTAWANIAP